MFTLQAGKQHAVAGTLDGKCCAANRGSQANEAEFIVPAVAGCLAAGAHPGSYNGQDAYNDMLIPAKGADSDTKPGHLLPVAIRTAQTSSNGCGIDESGTSYTMDGSQGQAVAVPVAFEPRFVRTTGGQPTTGPHPCLRSDANSGDGKPCVATAMQVRRLTPTECERLQGFPDGWTEGFSDSTRYKMLGNAVAVPCAEWIARRLIKEQQ